MSAADRKRFKLAVTTDEIDDDLDTALTFLKGHGLEHCEIRKVWRKYNTELPLEKIRWMRSRLNDAGVRLAILDTSFLKIPLPSTDAIDGVLKKQWDMLKRAFDNADALGTDLIRTFAFTHKRGESPVEANYPRIFELVAESAEQAHTAGFRLAVENVGNSYVATSAQSARLLKAVKSEALGLTWDPNNAAQSGDARPFPDGYNLLDAKRIWHVHFRDYQRKHEGGTEWCGVGDGEFDHVGQLRALMRDGYSGSVSLETHFTINGSRMAATKHSLQGLFKAVDKA